MVHMTDVPDPLGHRMLAYPKEQPAAECMLL